MKRKPAVSDTAPDFVRNVLGPMIIHEGDSLPVSALPIDGVFPTNTSRWDKRNIGLEIPVWESDLCIQCGKCSFVCPHAVIRQKIYDPKYLETAPVTFKSIPANSEELPDQIYTIQVSPRGLHRLCIVC